jgi:hypothetical protein
VGPFLSDFHRNRARKLKQNQTCPQGRETAVLSFAHHEDWLKRTREMVLRPRKVTGNFSPHVLPAGGGIGVSTLENQLYLPK